MTTAEAVRRTLELQLIGLMDATNTHLGFGCVRALLDHLLRRRLESGASNEEDYLDSMVQAVETTHLDSCMALSESTMEALAIFGSENHPNVTSGAPKQSLSLFTLVNGCKTVQGKQRMRDWFLQPSNDLKVIRNRHEAVQYILQCADSAVVKQLTESLRACLDMRRTMRSLDDGRALSSKRKGLDFAAIVNLAFNCVKIRRILAEIVGRQAVHHLNDCRQTFDQTRLMEVGALIRDTVSSPVRPLFNASVLTAIGRL